MFKLFISKYTFGSHLMCSLVLVVKKIYAYNEDDHYCGNSGAYLIGNLGDRTRKSQIQRVEFQSGTKQVLRK